MYWAQCQLQQTQFMYFIINKWYLWTPVVDDFEKYEHYLTCQFKYNCSTYLISGIFGTQCDLDVPSDSFRNLSITDTGESESGNPGTSGKF